MTFHIVNEFENILQEKKLNFRVAYPIEYYLLNSEKIQ